MKRTCAVGSPVAVVERGAFNCPGGTVVIGYMYLVYICVYWDQSALTNCFYTRISSDIPVEVCFL